MAEMRTDPASLSLAHDARAAASVFKPHPVSRCTRRLAPLAGCSLDEISVAMSSDEFVAVEKFTAQMALDG